jgi:hypothetical protein
MMPLQQLLPKLAGDFAILAVVGGIVGGIWRGEALGFSFAIGCLWLGLNTVLMGLLIAATSNRERPGGLTVSLVACAKIPLAYFLLLWLLSRAFIEPAGIIAALAALPVVMLVRGLTRQGRALA